MSFYIIIRGPLGIGKTTISKLLAKELNAKYISMDEIVDGNGLDKIKDPDGGISEKSFLKANETIIPKAKKELSNLKRVVIDGNFYRKSQIEDIVSKIKNKGYVFTLKAPLETCIERDSKRKRCYGKEAATAVHKMVSKFDHGIIIDTNKKTETEVVKEILSQLLKK